MPFDRLRANVNQSANDRAIVPFDRLRANVIQLANVLAKVPFVLSLSKHLFGIVSK